MPEKNIPHINQDFDLKLLVHILSKNLIWISFLLGLGIVTAFLLIRYTKPLYTAKSVIQLTSSENNNFVLDEKLNPYNTTNIAKEIELLKSSVFLQRVADKLPISVSYYSKGAILNFETYKSTPFYIEHDSLETAIYGHRFSIQPISETRFMLNCEKLNIKNRTLEYGEWIRLGISKFRVVLKADQKLENGEQYFFIFNNPKNFVDEIASKLTVNVLNDAAKTIEITYTGYNPVKVADVANAVAKEFEYFNVEKKQEGSRKVLQYIDYTLGLITTNIGENEKELSSFMTTDVLDPYIFQMEQSQNFGKRNSLEERSKLIRYDISVMEKIEKMPINSRSDVINLSAIIAGTTLEPSLTPSIERFNQLFTMYEDISYNSPEASPTLNKVKYQLEQQRAAYATALTSVNNILQEKLKDINTEASNIQIRKSLADTNNLNASILKRTKEVNEKFFNQLIDKKAEYTIAKEGFTPEYQILQYASVPDQPVAPNKQLIILSALGAWFLLSVLLVGVRYLLNDEILLINDISKYTDAPVLGMIHKYKEDIPVSQLVVDKKPKGLIAEAFRTIRSNLQFIHNEPGPKVISLTSTISGEGKTFVSMNLAGILAFSGSRTIILDCDMRKPKIHMGFEVDNDFGMSTLLIGKDTLEGSIRKSTMDKLDFITAGPLPPNPAELLLSSKMDELIQDLKTKYEYIIIDNPPSGLVSDSIVNLQRADYPIYVFRSDYSRKFFINNLTRLKDENKINKISIILNSVDLNKNKSYGYGYGYGSYNYGYGYGYGFGYYEEENNSKASKKSHLYNFIRGKNNSKS